MTLDRQGYVGLFTEPLDRETIKEFISRWLEQYDTVEQTLGKNGQVLTQIVHSIDEISWESDLQFRITCQEQFTWIYITENRQVIETSGLVTMAGATLSHDVLVGLEGCSEIIDDKNNRRLDQLEKEGLM
jgi:hypothetical protein